MTQIHIHAESLDWLKAENDRTGGGWADSVVTDPPYGLGKEPNPVNVMGAWVLGKDYEVSGTGFMGKSWDQFVPQPSLWKEVFRALKPGGHLLAACGTRTQDWMAMSLRFAGFELRNILCWVQAQGFPKSLSVSKSIDKQAGVEREVIGRYKSPDEKAEYTEGRNNGGSYFAGDTKNQFGAILTAPATDAAKQWEGWGTDLKPSVEMWTLCRKPLSEDTVAKNVQKYGTGGINIDGCRVDGSPEKTRFNPTKHTHDGYRMNVTDEETFLNASEKDGRFPANIILECTCTELMEADETIQGGFEAAAIGFGKVDTGEKNDYDPEKYQRKQNKYPIHTDPNCPCYLLDIQSGNRKSGAMKKLYFNNNNSHSIGKFKGATDYCEANEGGASRFYQQASFTDRELDEMEKIYFCPKASKSEKNFGLAVRVCATCGLTDNDTNDHSDCEGQSKPMSNIHPTAKPVSLMCWLVRLITPPGGMVLDPFMGSGTTGIAAKLEWFSFVGIEREADYFAIAEARIAAWKADGNTDRIRKPPLPKPITAQGSLF